MDSNLTHSALGSTMMGTGNYISYRSINENEKLIDRHVFEAADC